MAYFKASFFKARYFQAGFLAGIPGGGPIIIAAIDWLTIARRRGRR